MQSKWIAHQTESTSHKINLLCIPYAGASANIFGEWKKIFPEEYGIFPMLFPMRETRFADPMPDTLKELAETFVNETPELFQKPVVIFGHCTGAVVAYEIALAMKRILHCEPAVLIVSSSNAPDSIPEEMKRLASASDAGLAEYLKSEKQIDSDMLEDEDFTDYYFPLIREDFRFCAEYRVPEAEMLNCPVIAVYDSKDAKINPEKIEKWAQFTNASFRVHQVDGGHYYLDNPEKVMQILPRIQISQEELDRQGYLLARQDTANLNRNYLNYFDRLEFYSRIMPDKIALTENDTHFTYREMMQEIGTLTAFFHQEGLKKGDCVALQMENCAVFFFIFFALLEIGIVPIMLLPAHKKNEIQGVIQKARPVAIITDNPGLTQEEYSVRIYQKHQLEHLDKSESYIVPQKDRPDCTELAILLLSGGTTGIPKLIPRTQADYIYNNEALARKLNITENSVFLAVLPLAHNFPLGAPGAMGTFLMGGTVVICQYASPVEIFSLIESEKVTYTALVPTVLNMCIQYRSYDDSDDLSSLNMIMVGGAVLPESVAQKVDSCFDCKLIQIFGTAEGLCCINSLEDDWNTRCTVQGKPCSPYDELRFIDDSGEDVPDGQPGELITRGAYTIRNYYGMDDKQNQYFTPDGFYRTGDKAYLDENKNLVILGRAKEQINRGGEKIMPGEIEELLLQHEHITECAVAGIPDEVLGNRICVFAVSDGAELSLQEIRKFLKLKGLADFKLPDQLQQMETMPYTAAKKIDKKKLTGGISVG